MIKITALQEPPDSVEKCNPREQNPRYKVESENNVTRRVKLYNKLHNTLDELKDKNSDLVQSLSNQVTYVKKLDPVIGINSQAVANLTTVIKDNPVHLHEKFQNITKDIAWLHFTVQGQTALFTAVRQIEFSLL